MNKILSKIKNGLELLFYSAIVIFFLFLFPIWLFSRGFVLTFVFMYLPIILFLIIGFFLSRKDRKYEQENISEEIVEDEKLGNVKVVKDSFKHTCKFLDCSGLFDDYEVSIHFDLYREDSQKLYLDALGYVKDYQVEIEENLKKLYLSIYEKDEIERQFKIKSISSETYKEVSEYCINIEEQRILVEGEEELKEFIQFSKEGDFFLCIYAECDLSEFAVAYLNVRTKKICYCLDKLD